MHSLLRWAAPAAALTLLVMMSVHQDPDHTYAAQEATDEARSLRGNEAVTPVPTDTQTRRTQPNAGGEGEGDTAGSEVVVNAPNASPDIALKWWWWWSGKKPNPTKTPVATATPAPPTSTPTFAPTQAPTITVPTSTPTTAPTQAPTVTVPTSTPTKAPTQAPTVTAPTSTPTKTATPKPPTFTPTAVPPTFTPTSVPPTSTPSPTIWKPPVQTNWHIQFTGTLDTSVPAQLFDIDLFDHPASTVSLLKSKGARVICYMSAGSWEDWRPDASQFPAVVKGNSNGWAGENYLDIRRIDILGPIMEKRLDLCKAKGFDAVDFDNVDTYLHTGSGFSLTYADQLNYNRYLANAAHARGLSVGLKNDLEQIKDLVAYFDFAINEECFSYNECDMLLPFIQAGKAVFIIEYDTPSSAFCSTANAKNFNAGRKRWSLDAWRENCR